MDTFEGQDARVFERLFGLLGDFLDFFHHDGLFAFEDDVHLLEGGLFHDGTLFSDFFGRAFVDEAAFVVEEVLP
jgi:hypothetical protein